MDELVRMLGLAAEDVKADGKWHGLTSRRHPKQSVARLRYPGTEGMAQRRLSRDWEDDEMLAEQARVNSDIFLVGDMAYGRRPRPAPS